MNHLRVIGSTIVTTMLCLSLFGCGGPPPRPVPPPPEVTLSPPTKKDVTAYLEYTGTTAALESVDIRTRVGGYVDKMLFEPGARVNAGDLLFIIDPRPYHRRVEQAKAAVEFKRAALRIREIELEKYTPLAGKEVVTGLKLDDVKSARDMAAADVDQAIANLETAKLDMEYAHVKSPINGRVSRNRIDVGNLVGVNENVLLATVVSDDQIYVYFNISELDLLKLKRKALIRNSGDSKLEGPETPVYMGLADETGFPRTGLFDYTDPKVDPSTGTIQARAIFKNTDGILYAGMFARVKVPLETKPCLLVPDAAIVKEQGGKFVYLCNSDNVVEPRKVRTGELVEDMRVIEEGLNNEERIIVNGLQKARPGAKVSPVQASAQASSPPSAPASSSKN
ncbi:MAG: efflux RND transporter periplasmic adaptor subunit [Pseudomonadota bacterium]